MKKYFTLVFVALAFNLSVLAAAPTCGLTIITHGFQPPGHIPVFGSDGALPGWVREMAQAITNRVGSAVPIYRIRYDKDSDTVLIQDDATSIDITQKGGAIVLLDWVGVANETLDYPAQNVADRFFNYLFGQIHNGRNLTEIPIHLIGHSRGCSLNAQLSLNLAGNGVLVDQVTTLDPHPVRPFDQPVGGSDLIPVTYINVLFADNYYRTGAFPAGESVSGALNNNLSATIDGDDCSEHESVHTYFHGTVKLTATAIDSCNIQNIWYQQSTPRDETGYNFSRYVNPLLSRPSSGVNQHISGAGGTGSRVSVDSPQQLSSNAGFDQRSSIPSAVTVGQTVAIPYYFADRNSAQTITFYTDADTNPFNGFRSQIGSANQSSRPTGNIGTAVFQWTPTAADVGTHFIRVKGANASNARYDYYFRTITVQAAVTPAPTISSVSPRILNGLPLPQTNLITITGTGFTGSSRLTFNDGVNPPYTNKVPESSTATQLTYNIAVGPNPATWTVKVVNGTTESSPYSFYVVSGGVHLSGLGVSGPFAIAENGSGQFTATAYFSDGSQQNVTSSVSWGENSSATTISTSGLLSAGSVSSDTAVTVSASYTTGDITKSATANVTVANSGSCGTTISERILNGTFTNNGNNWTLTGNFQADARFSNCSSCPGYAYLANADGSGGNNLSGTLSQSITIPANATSVILGYYYRITTSEAGGTAFDFLSLNLVLPGGTLVGIDERSNLHANAGYAYRSFDITAYKGQTIAVRFTATTDGNLPTVFRVDDVSVITSAPNPVTPVLFGVGGPTNVTEGSTAQYNAIVVNCDGSIQSVTPTWSENSSVTSISSSGLLTVGSVSTDTPVIITANYNGFPSLNYAIKVVNSGVTFSYLAISGPSSIDENGSGQFTASAIFSDGSSQSVSPSWSENSTATTISSGGLLTTSEVNDDAIVTVSATHTIGGVTRTADQEVLLNNSLPPALISLTVDGPGSVIEYGVASFTATARFSDGASAFNNGAWAENNSATSISMFGLLSAGEVTNDTLVTVSFSYNFGAVTLNASKNILVLDGGTPPELPYEAKAFASVSTSVPSVVAVAQNGGLVLFGNFTGTITVGGQQLTANGSASDFFAMKLNSSNQVVWVRQYGGANEEVINSAAPHSSGGWVVAGNFRSAGLIGSVTLNSSGNRDAFVARLDESGNVLWANRCGGTGIDYGREAAADSLGNCFLFGDFRGTASFGNGAVTFTAPGTLSDVFIAKYDTAGTFQWARALSGPQADTVRCVASDLAGSVFVGGAFEQQITIGGQTLVIPGDQTGNNAFVAKFAQNGDLRWAKQIGEPAGFSSSEYLFFLTVASNGACFFGGSYDGPMTLDGQTLPQQTASTAFAGKISAAGATEWLQALPAEGDFRSDRLLVGTPLGDQSLIVGGTFSGRLPVGATILTNTSPSGAPADNQFWAKLNPAGTPQWGISAGSDHGGDIYLIEAITDALIRSVVRFNVSGTLPGVGVLSPGNYFVVDFGPQAMPAPVLTLSQQAGQMILAWHTNGNAFQLESSTTLLPSSWTTDSSAPSRIGSNYVVTNVIAAPARFYRLKRP